MVIVQDFGGVVVENTNDGAGEVGGTVRGIHPCFEIGLCGSGETDEREHEGDGESERHRQPRREAQCRRGRITPKRRGHCEMLVLIGGSVSKPRDSARGLWCLWLPLTGQLLRFGNLGWGHLLGEIIAVSSRDFISVSCRQAVPHVGLD